MVKTEILQVGTENLYNPDFGKGKPEQREVKAHG